MRLSIGQKIFGAAFSGLVLMTSVSIYSIHVFSQLGQDMRGIAHNNLPVMDGIDQVNGQYLIYSGLMQRTLLPATSTAERQTKQTELRKQLDHHHKRTEAAFHTLRNLLLPLEDVLALQYLEDVHSSFQNLQSHGQVMITARANGDDAGYIGLLPLMAVHKTAVETDIVRLRKHMFSIIEQTVDTVDETEAHILEVNTVLTILAALTALGVALAVTRCIGRSVRNLRTGTKAIENGDYDTELPITSDDEIGDLTATFNTMVGELRSKEQIKATFGQFMDPRVVENLLKHPELTAPGGKRQEMTVMFIDLQGYTAISERLNPDQLVVLINCYFRHITEAISANKGVIDKYMGDAVMAYWGEPFSPPEQHADLACKAALQTLEHLDAFRAEVREAIGPDIDGLELNFRIGISSGPMVVGTVGTESSRNFTVMGDMVNIASRLEGANKAYGTHILTCQNTQQKLRDTHNLREIDYVRVKGKQRTIIVHELVEAGRSAPCFAPALAAYRNQDWATAEQCFAEDADDPVAQIFLERISHLKASPPPVDWDGIWVLESK